MYKIILLYLLSCIPLSSCSNKPKPDGKLQGVITYFFNDNYGDKPDVGAMIQICDKKEVRQGIVDSLRIFMNAKSYINHISFCEGMSKSYSRMGLNEYKSDIDGFKIEIEKAKKDLLDRCKITFEEFEKIKEKLISLTLEVSIHKLHELAADGNGNYEIPLPSGSYIVLVKSNHRKNYNTGEILGVLDMEEAYIEPSKTTVKNFNFSLSDSD